MTAARSPIAIASTWSVTYSVDAHELVEPDDLESRFGPELGIEVRHRLVHQQQARARSPAHRRPLLLAARELCGIAVEQVGQLQQLRDLGHLAGDLALAELGDPQREADVLADREMRIEDVVLEHHRHVAGVGGRVVPDAVDEHLHLR